MRKFVRQYLRKLGSRSEVSEDVTSRRVALLAESLSLAPLPADADPFTLAFRDWNHGGVQYDLLDILGGLRLRLAELENAKG